MIFPGVHN